MLAVLSLEKSDIKEQITQFSAEYWNYKGFYNFPTAYKGHLIYEVSTFT